MLSLVLRLYLTKPISAINRSENIQVHLNTGVFLCSASICSFYITYSFVYLYHENANERIFLLFTPFKKKRRGVRCIRTLTYLCADAFFFFKYKIVLRNKKSSHGEGLIWEKKKNKNKSVIELRIRLKNP